MRLLRRKSKKRDSRTPYEEVEKMKITCEAKSLRKRGTKVGKSQSIKQKYDPQIVAQFLWTDYCLDGHT